MLYINIVIYGKEGLRLRNTAISAAHQFSNLKFCEGIKYILVIDTNSMGLSNKSATVARRNVCGTERRKGSLMPRCARRMVRGMCDLDGDGGPGRGEENKEATVKEIGRRNLKRSYRYKPIILESGQHHELFSCKKRSAGVYEVGEEK